jgi:hypothetical protein
MPQDFGGVMREFSQGKLHSGSKKGPKVKSRAQAQAIAASEDKKFKATNHQKHDLKQGFKKKSNY